MTNYQLTPLTFANKNFSKLLFTTILLFITQNLVSQDASDEFKTTVESLISKAPKTYKEIDDALRPHSRDTSKTKFFIQKAKEANYLEGQSYAINRLGMRYRYLSYLDKSIKQHLNALAIAEQADNNEFRIFSLNMLGVSYRRKDAVKTAIDYHKKALETADTLTNKTLHVKRNINVALNSIGNLYQTLGQYDLAITQFKQALEFERELNNKKGLAINNQNIGDCLEQKEELETALEYYRKSLAYNEEINNFYGLVICKNSIARIYTKQGMPNAALSIYEPLEEQALKIGDNFVTSSVYINMGSAQTQIGDYINARKNIEKGLQLSEESQMPALIIAAKRYLADLGEAVGDYKEALKQQKEAEDYENKIINQRNLSRFNRHHAIYNVQKVSFR